MKMKNKLVPVFFSVMTLLATSCDDFLGEPTDNRTKIDTPEKIEYLLRSAYAPFSYSIMAELASDNVDDYGENNPYTDRLYDQMATWEDVTENQNDNPYYAWRNYYSAIAVANQALESIEELGGGEKLDRYRAEALLCRAYAHFMLANLFCMPYDKDSNSRLGLTYMLAPETTLNPKYERESLEATYQHIANDIEEGLPLLNDTYLNIPKYHFNRNAAYAFASRFYLYYCNDNTSEEGKERLKKVINYAEKVLGSNPASMMRNTQAFIEIGSPDPDAYPLQYIKQEENANLMLQTAGSQGGLYWLPAKIGCRFSHGTFVAKETFQSATPWGDNTYQLWNIQPAVYTATNFDKYLIMKIPYMFEFVDPVAQTGYPRTVYPAFTSEEVLFNWAEAKVLLGGDSNYNEAVNYLNIWSHAWMTSGRVKLKEMTVESINAFYNSIKDYEPDVPTIKKKLNPSFTITPGSQENMIHCILHARRVTFIHEGLRWFDLKRYGITVHRRKLDTKGSSVISWETLEKNDLRRAFQLPQEVIYTGYEANPR